MGSWYVRREGSAVVGPVEHEAMLRGIAEGKVREEFLVSNSAQGPWVPSRSVREFGQAWSAAALRAPTGTGLEVGESIAGFHLVSRLGEGGMAVVYRGENTLDASIVRAVKVMHPELSSRKEFRARVAEEARILERLNHRNIVRFYGVRQERGFLVLELELLEGESLGAMLGRGHRFGLRDAVESILQAADGVAVAHAMGVVHRDLKPENLFRTTDGVIKVLDFGIARALDEADRATRATTPGATPGTAAYLAPEVWGGAVPDARADVYALGLSLLELVVGHHPFTSPGEPQKSSPQLMFMHLQGQLLPLRQLSSGVPELLDRIVQQATAKQPAERFPNAGAFADALRGVLAQLPAGSAPASKKPLTEFALPQFQRAPTTGRAVVSATSPPKRRTWLTMVALGVGVVVLGAVVGVSVVAATSRRDDGKGVAIASAAVPSSSSSPAVTPSSEAQRLNPWVRIEPPRSSPVRLGVDDEHSPDPGFRPSRGISAPSTPYEIQQHEVTWQELDPWLAAHPDSKLTPLPGVVLSGDERSHAPAVGIPWGTALSYCKSIGGTLPNEEQWEYAARGAERRPHPWGSEPLDIERTRAYAGKSGSVGPVMSSDQDQTPGDPAEVIYDLAGNALEWTVDLYRDDRPKQDESWVESDGMSYRALRGLPLTEARPKQMPQASAAYRQALCVGAKCPSETAKMLATVGFRCVRHAAGHASGAASGIAPGATAKAPVLVSPALAPKPCTCTPGDPLCDCLGPSPPPAAPKKRGGDCGCNGDLMCLMKCSTH